MNVRKLVEQARPIEVTREQRYRLIHDAVSFRALHRQRLQPMHREDMAAACWCEVEAEIDQVLKRRK